MLCTATGLLPANVMPSRIAASRASFLLPYTALTSPTLSASSAPKKRAVMVTSLTHESEPTTFGSRESVPMSAASPISTSLTAKVVDEAQMRMSVAQAMSMARPREKPWRTEMTAVMSRRLILGPHWTARAGRGKKKQGSGIRLSHRSAAEIASWNSWMCFRNAHAFLAGSTGASSSPLARPPTISMFISRSSPAVNAFSPAPDRTIQRTEESPERRSKMEPYSSHMLYSAC